MVNITRRQLMTRIYRDYGDGANFGSSEYLGCAIKTFYRLLGINQEEAHPTLVNQVKTACKRFVDSLRIKWKSRQVQHHLDRLEEIHKTWLTTKFVIPHLDEVPKVQTEEEPSDAAPGPSVQVTTSEDQPPPPAKKQKLSFLEKVIRFQYLTVYKESRYFTLF